MEAMSIEAIKMSTIMEKKIRNCKETRSSFKIPAMAFSRISFSYFFVKPEAQHDQHGEQNNPDHAVYPIDRVF